MIKSTHKQLSWQKKFAAELDPNLIWWNPTNHDSLRLNKVGAKIAKNTLESYLIKISTQLKPKHLLLLERGMPAPYYIEKHDRLEVFDQTVATMLTLHAGDLDTYLTNLLTY